MVDVRKTEATFRLGYAVSAEIAAPTARVWALLTDADGFTRWNGTVTELRGPIALGRRLAIRVPISPRTFKPKVTVFEPERRMVWSDGAAPFFKGTRTFTLEPRGDSTHFSMVEVFAGVMLPLIKRSLPDFRPTFEQTARDLQRAAQ